MRLKLTAIVLILLIVSIIAGCAPLKRIEQGIMKNQETLGKQGEELGKQNKQLADLQESVNSVNQRVGKLEGQVTENDRKNKEWFDKIDGQIASINSQLAKFQKGLEAGNREDRESAVVALNSTIEECKENCQMILTVKKHKTINIRSGPSTNEKVVGVLKGGDKVTIVLVYGTWGKIKDTENWCTILHYWTQIGVEPVKTK